MKVINTINTYTILVMKWKFLKNYSKVKPFWDDQTQETHPLIEELITINSHAFKKHL